MSTAFDASVIERHGWRQGAVLGAGLVAKARILAPNGIVFAENDWLIVTSHDCDIVNWNLEKEPTVELLRASVVPKEKPDKQQVWGRNPREMQLAANDGAGGQVVLSAKVHERWSMPRDLLASEAPHRFLDNKTRRLIAEWLAKRYIRAAFPTAFDARWRSKMKDWIDLLEGQSQLIQGIYLRLSTQAELSYNEPYKTHLIVAAPAEATTDPVWAKKKSQLESLVEKFWKQFGPGIECAGVEVIATNALTLADIANYQRFDADWVSFADDSPATPPSADMQA
ncbi:MAG: hypothetical protein IPN34_16745 [Planctomycetes bacterium]|nr:hypothetical protein [Planctomycetota bacterium]